MSIRILIIDDHFVQRLGLTVAINNEKDLRIAGQGGSVAEAVSLYEKLKPDIVTLDITMPEMDGLSAMKQILAINPAARVIIVSAVNSKDMIVQALNGGAKAYIVKPFSETQIVETITEVMNAG